MADKISVQLKACTNGDIYIIINGKQTGVIHDNQTSDADIFDSLNYEPGNVYVRIADVPDVNINKSVFESVEGLFDSIIKGINDINENAQSVEDEPEIDDE